MSGIFSRKRGGAICLTILNLVSAVLVAAPAAKAQNGANQAPTSEDVAILDDVANLPDCKRAVWGKKCVIKVNVDGRKDSAVGTYLVGSGTEVHLLVFKSPFEKVKFDPERKEVAAAPDPVTELIKLLVSSAGSISLMSAAADKPDTFDEALKELEKARQELVDVVPQELKPEQNLVVVRFNSFKQQKTTRLMEIERVTSSYDKLKKQLDNFLGHDELIKNQPSQWFCQPLSTGTSNQFGVRRALLVGSIGTEVKGAAPLSTAGEELLLKTLSESLNKLPVQLPSTLCQKEAQSLSADETKGCREEAEKRGRSERFLQRATEAFAQAAGIVRLLQSAVSSLDEARKNLTTIAGALGQLDKATCAVDIPQVADRQADLSGNVVFTNLVTGQDDSRKLFAKVSYRDLPRASVSTGILLSALEKRKFSISQKSDGPGDAPTDNVKSHTEIGAEASKPQVIPFSFINVRLAYWRIGSRMFTFNFAPGVGINANGGTTEAEFAFGPSLGVGNLYFFGGAHFARDPHLAGGFNVGDRVPKDFSLPVVRSWKTTFGFGVSYRLPLP